jgi:cytoskeletal protein CcmA (bactofilin family)
MNSPNAKNASVTLIGPEMRIEGNVAFAGVLRVHGEIAGDVASNQPGQGLLVVEDSGKVTGTIVAPRVVLKGRILGSVRSEGLVEIHRGGHVCGDVSYRQVDVRSGGVVDGKLSLAEGRPAEQALAAESLIDVSTDTDATTGLDEAPPGRWRGKLAWGAAALAAVIVGVMWMRPAKQAIKPVGVDLSPPVAPITLPATTPPPPVAEAPRPEPVAVTKPTPAPEPVAAQVPVPPPTPAAQPAAPAKEPTAAVAAPADRGRIVTIQGTNPEKSATQFFVTTREAVVMQRKKRGDPGEGKPIEIAKNRNTSLQIGAGEIFRVAQGSNVDIFYQGRRVSKSNIDNGDWLGFVPYVAGN